MTARALRAMIGSMVSHSREPTRFALRSGGRQVAVVEAWTPSEALIEYLRGRGFQDSDIVRVGYHAAAWRGQIFTATAADADATVGTR